MPFFIEKLKIAGLVIEMRSRSPFVRTRHQEAQETAERFECFSYRGRKEADIVIDVNVVKELPKEKADEDIFVTHHFEDGQENWRLQKKGKSYIYRCPMDTKKQFVRVSHDLSRAEAYVLPKEDAHSMVDDVRKVIKSNKGMVWDKTDLVYDFLQVLLINYLSKYRKGFIMHAMGVKDIDGRGFIFTGESGAGKSTLARIWDGHSRAQVLNDDRVIVRKIGRRFRIYGSPWHGDFNDYLTSRQGSAELHRIHFIHKSKSNKAVPVEGQRAFLRLYPNFFPAFWDAQCLRNMADMGVEMLDAIACVDLYFQKDKRVVQFVRGI